MINTITNLDTIEEKVVSLTESPFDIDANEKWLKDIQQQKTEEKHTQQKEADKLKSLLAGDKKEQYLGNKFLEIGSFYKSWIKIINNITVESLYTEMKEYADIDNENVKKNINIIVQICKQLSDRTKENIYAVIWSDWSIHLVNDIDTWHYIITKNIIENLDVLLFVKDIWGKKEIAATRIESLEDMTYNNEILQVRDNVPLLDNEN